MASLEPTCPQCGGSVSLPDYADLTVCEFCGSTLAREQVRALQEEKAGGLESQRLRSVRCSQCAGPLSAYEGRRILVCDHCGVRVVVLERGGLSRWYFPARADRIAAAAAGASWLRDYPGIARDFRYARLIEAKLVYAPIWEHKALTAGWEFGSQARTRMVLARHPTLDGEAEESLQLELIHESVQDARLQERRFYLPATDFESLGARRPRVTGRELLVPLIAGEIESTATVLSTAGVASEVVERGRNAARLPLSGALRPDVHVFVFRETAALLYYPLWLLRYRQGDVDNRIVVDGRHGTVNSATAPADQRRRLLVLAAEVGALTILGAVLAYLAVSFRAARVPLLAAAVVVSVAAIVAGLRFRPEKEVEYHDSFSG
jgi:DNA-directed RNA polymerase subunit RPC12/RpoP/ribosomal protein S27AE